MFTLHHKQGWKVIPSILRSCRTGAYATDVAVLDDQVLVTDLEQFAVYRIDPGSLAVAKYPKQGGYTGWSAIPKSKGK